MAYRSIHTTYGLQQIAQAEATGTQINLTHMAVGDGNGMPVEPSEVQTQLVRETYRATVNRVYQHPDDPGRFTAEMIVPAEVGGFTMREIGVFDADGGLFVVGNLPAAYKPEGGDGAFADTVLRVEFVVANVDIITLVVDPNVAVATQQWIANTITVCYLLPGGTTGQILRKVSNNCGDVEWADPDVASVVVDMIDERQVLAADQTVVEWAVVTTRGLAVYVEGVRLYKGPGENEWQEDPAEPDTKIVLGKSYPAGTEIIGTQNEPAGSVPFPLVRDQNLADVPNKAQALENLGTFGKLKIREMAPPGEVSFFARNTAPPGWLKANGAAVSRTAYADLFAAIGTTWGAGDGFTTFNLPDLRGEFLRGWDDGRGLDPGRLFASVQNSQNLAHSHAASTTTAGSHTHTVSYDDNKYYAGGGSPSQGSGRYSNTRNIATASSGAHSHGVNVSSSGGSEARPRNVALLACIKF